MDSEQPTAYYPSTDLDIAVWRYIDIEKFVGLLSTKDLYFPRTDLLGDPYEGTMSHTRGSSITDLLANNNQSKSDGEAALSAAREAYRSWTYVSCWHMNEDESAAMWSQYARMGKGVAIRSTYRKLRAALPERINIGTVSYIDYQTHQIPEGKFEYTLVHKRRSFQHEREVRAVIEKQWYDDADDMETMRAKIFQKNLEEGQAVPVNLNTLILGVYLPPFATPLLAHVVKSLVNQYEFEFEVYPSALDLPPVF